MFIPQLLFCIGASCYIAAGDPQPDEARCREHITGVMVVTMRQAIPDAMIRAGRCLPVPQDPAA
jgi:hypothetical protein